MGKHFRDQNGIKIKLSTKLIVSIVLLECLLMSAIILVVEKQMRASILDEFMKHGLSITRNLAAINSNFVTTYNYVNIEQNVERVVKENGLLYAVVLFYDGEVAAYSGRELIDIKKRDPVHIEQSHEIKHGNIPIYAGERQWGILGYERCKINNASSTAALDAIKTVAGNLGAAIQQKLTLKSLEDANRLKDDFLANMSHELRTPLNHVIGFTELVVDKQFGDLNEIQEEYLKDVLHSSRHLLSLINDILDISKIETGRLSLELSKVDLRRLIENSIKVLQPKSMEQGVRLDKDIGDIPEYITADQRKLEQILYNLLSNGVKFTSEGGKVCITTRQVHCHIRQARRSQDGNNRLIVAVSSEIPEDSATTKGKAIKFSISDTGIGINQEDQKRIFNSFEQVDGSSSRQYGGAGLGLSLAQRLVELHGGRIWVDSAGTDKGSTFSYVIPI